MEEEESEGLPIGVSLWLRDQFEVEVLNFVSVPGGYASGLAGLFTVSGNVFFMKAIPADSPAAADYVIESRVACALASIAPTPRLLNSGLIAGWSVLVFDAVRGRMPDEPWRSDELQAVVRLFGELSLVLTPSPVLDLPTVVERMRGRCVTWTQLESTGSYGEVSLVDLTDWEIAHLSRLAHLERSWEDLVQGETLLHFDLRHDNLKVDARGRICVLDWGRACIGPAWVDIICLLLESDSGSTDLETLFHQSAGAATADPLAVDAFLTVLASYWRHAVTFADGVPDDLKRRRKFSLDSTLLWLQQRWSN